MTKTKKRRTAAKRHGETFAQQLAREHAEKQKFGYEVGIEVAKEVKQEVASDLMKLMVIAINREFGIGMNACVGSQKHCMMLQRNGMTLLEWKMISNMPAPK